MVNSKVEKIETEECRSTIQAKEKHNTIHAHTNIFKEEEKKESEEGRTNKATKKDKITILDVSS